ncbi:hypothetical protein ACYCS5_03125 [Paenibacillus sp. SEL3]|uniref:Uncharacterized protein n=1 Tax=Paenibacillus polymyxa TaxID=1406 RepID=A0A8I1IPL9_PAEPO|nr:MULTISPECIES: hypothetical protein [unclassified Paenibacillus]KAF6572225.1 hypothetical protein G9G53_15620 [Paenibacillus sp. EKM206P]KAF6586638.1 hypothetical protein G9G52_18625 [Paenibacillus sp. EKM205P]MBM0634874.1 hypothetical protein [Paenibacillus polymyxa]
MTTKFKANEQAIKDIVRMRPVWTQEVEHGETELHYYHIMDALNRKWQNIGINVSDAIEVFEKGHNDAWTYILEPAPFNPDLTANDLINRLQIGPDAWHIRNAMQIILNSVERRNAFVSRLVNVNREDICKLLCTMKNEYLQHNQLSDETFIHMYGVNPVEALSVYFLESVDIHTHWEWCDAGGTSQKAIQYKREAPFMTLVQAIERAELET